MNRKVLAIFAHPDDIELMCAGTLSLLKRKGWKIHLATMTPGDKGTAVHSVAEIVKIRMAEALKSARLLDASYDCLGYEDVFIFYNRESISKTTELIRKIQPSIVFTASPQDYMVDHEMTSLIVQSSCFSCGMKNMELSEKAFEPVPYLYYSDAMEGNDKFGNPVQPTIYVDISNDMVVKEQMLACHESQRNWLLEHHKIDEYLIAMKRFAEKRGSEIGVRYAEGFRQHLGHSYPHDNILKEIIGEQVYIK
ncbi:MAG: PIG-L family deacetylase [Bacteroidales bacterium]|nr:PIG-L family deacetylase [Bacteroidales bacterium]